MPKDKSETENPDETNSPEEQKNDADTNEGKAPAAVDADPTPESESEHASEPEQDQEPEAKTKPTQTPEPDQDTKDSTSTPAPGPSDTAAPDADQIDIIDSEKDAPEIREEAVEDVPIKRRKRDEVKRSYNKEEEGVEFWVPKTRLGKLVKNGEITTMKDALATGLAIREPEIVDILLPELDDEVLDVNMVQRMTDSGRRVRFVIMTVVGNGNGYVGLGGAKGKEVGPAIRKAIDNAKLNIIAIRRGCGSWECGCGQAHTLPFTVQGKSGSTVVKFRPAPRGVGLAVGDVAKHILRLSGVDDAWGFTRGETRTTINYAKAIFEALRNTAKIKTTEPQVKNLNIKTGIVEVEKPEGALPEPGPEVEDQKVE